MDLKIKYGYMFRMSVQSCEFTVLGTPVGKGRPRFSKNGHAYTPQKTRDFEKRVRSAAWAEMQRSGLKPSFRRINMIITSYFDIPKSYSNRKKLECQAGIIIPKRPDVDNIGKAVADACNGIVYDDDAQIWFLAMSKQYCDEGQEAHIRVKVQWFDPNISSQDHIIPATS